MIQFQRLTAFTFFAFLAANVLLSMALGFFPMETFFGPLTTNILFGAKTVGFLWFNAYPRDKSVLSTLFFGLAVADIVCWFGFGAFSIYSLLGFAL
ncbi:hypothetical protein ACFE33_00425 [Falsihalocynthiibacter sp. SS001]|uniref:hypothetical protein n=1 Tax=Falsihalocynthiibacter sp. SS001 TaxID=3349698 RepID=UPI0036D2F68C